MGLGHRVQLPLLSSDFKIGAIVNLGPGLSLSSINRASLISDGYEMMV